MEGPRPIRQAELPALRRLLNHVFMPRGEGDMFALFPTFLSSANRGNLLVYADSGHIVSHVGMALQWASLGGCAVGVATIGAVATHPDQRGKGLASSLMDLACSQARDWGADIMLISGGRGLYRRLGAADVGVETSAVLSATDVDPLSSRVALEPYQSGDLGTCIALYGRRQACFHRPREVWETLLDAQVCMCQHVRTFIARIRGAACAYFVVSHDAEYGALRVLEFAGGPVAIAESLSALLRRFRASTIEVHLQAEDEGLATMLRGTGATLNRASAMGTCLLLDPARLIDRLRPHLAVRAGSAAADDLRLTPQGSAYALSSLGESVLCDGKAETAELLFGHPERDRRTGVFRSLFPIPCLWYGLSYV